MIFDKTISGKVQNMSQVVWTVYGCYCMPMDHISMCSNNLYMTNMDTYSSLRWLSVSTMKVCHNFNINSLTAMASYMRPLFY